MNDTEKYLEKQANNYITECKSCIDCGCFTNLCYDKYDELISCSNCQNNIDVRKYLEDNVILVKYNLKFSNQSKDRLLICNLSDKSDKFEIDYISSAYIEFNNTKNIIINYPNIFINMGFEIYLINMKKKTSINIPHDISLPFDIDYFLPFCQFIGNDKVKLKVVEFTNSAYPESPDKNTKNIIINTNTLKITNLPNKSDRFNTKNIIINYPNIYIIIRSEIYLINIKKKTSINIPNDISLPFDIDYFLPFCEFIGNDKVKLKVVEFNNSACLDKKIKNIIINTNTLKIIN